MLPYQRRTGWIRGLNNRASLLRFRQRRIDSTTTVAHKRTTNHLATVSSTGVHFTKIAVIIFVVLLVLVDGVGRGVITVGVVVVVVATMVVVDAILLTSSRGVLQLFFIFLPLSAIKSAYQSCTDETLTTPSYVQLAPSKKNLIVGPVSSLHTEAMFSD